ncbi:serine hydrolase [uncultured Corynebacterium sp.]|uniref:serine hydrolase n=1 Tax=uncultured Corynebacterium sp. TaxID=159447 RepID=UPI0025D6824A|nr:serine hydrolase [uncultured Corynebacterium sp.]
MSTSPDRYSAGLVRAVVTVPAALVALTLGGCVIGTTGDGDAEAGQTVVTVTDGAPDPTGPSGPTAAAAPTTGEVPGAAPGAPGAEVTVGAPYSLAYLDNGTVVTAGDLGTTVAWSTSKVPVAVAALRAVDDGSSLSDAATVHSNVTAAITASDNAAAQALWDSLGDPATAGQKVERVLREGGDATTTVQTRVVREGFTSFGQTLWPTADQVRFAAGLSCLSGAQPVLTAMGQIAAGQDYGLGHLPGARYKGGWGPATSGGYQVRQFGLVPGADGTLVPVAVAVTSPDGSYESGSAALSEIVDQLGATLGSARGVASGC